MHHNGQTPGVPGARICGEPNVWIVNGIFPVEYIDSTATATQLDPYFTEVIARLWRAVLRGPADQAAYRRYECLPWAADHARAFVGGLSPGALKRFPTTAGVDWRTPPVEPTCDHVACHQEDLFIADEWAIPPSGRLRAGVAMALAARVEGQARWPALAVPQAATDEGRPAARRWPRPRPRPWEESGEGDGR